MREAGSGKGKDLPRDEKLGAGRTWGREEDAAGGEKISRGPKWRSNGAGEGRGSKKAARRREPQGTG